MMSSKRGRELQERLGKEAVALLSLFGTPAETESFERAITLTGKVWKIPENETRKWLDAIAKERGYAECGSEEHVYPQEELPINATGLETLNAVWDLFETAVHLDDERERIALLEMAQELSEQQNLLDWIEKTPEEKAV